MLFSVKNGQANPLICKKIPWFERKFWEKSRKVWNKLCNAIFFLSSIPLDFSRRTHRVHHQICGRTKHFISAVRTRWTKLRKQGWLLNYIKRFGFLYREWRTSSNEEHSKERRDALVSSLLWPGEINLVFHVFRVSMENSRLWPKQRLFTGIRWESIHICVCTLVRLSKPNLERRTFLHHTFFSQRKALTLKPL